MSIREARSGSLPKMFECIRSHFSCDQVFGRFVDGDYHFWRVNSLWNATETVSPKMVILTCFRPKLTNWFPDGSDVDLDRLLEHYVRMQSSSLSCPILASSDFDIIDGNHRYLQARYKNREKILTTIIENFPRPELICKLPEKKNICENIQSQLDR